MTHDPRVAWGPVSRVKHLNRQVGSNYPALIRALGEVLSQGYWRDFEISSTGGRLRFDDFADFLAWCKFPANELVAVLQAHKESALLARVRAELGGELAEHGEIGGGHTGGRVCDTKSVSDQTDATYVVARLNRDRPDLAEKVMAGDISPNAAAVEAGFRRRYIRVPAGDVQGAVSKLLSEFSRDELLDALRTA